MGRSSLPWHVVEKSIAEEIKWLKETILESPYEKYEKVCKNCVYRKLAIFILTGKIKAKDIKSSISLFGRKKSFHLGKPHGKKWHFGMMKRIATYFKTLGYDVVPEPNLALGRADLGVYKNGERSLFVEVGTVSLYKLLFNLSSMKGSDLLLVLDTNHAIEFVILE